MSPADRLRDLIAARRSTVVFTGAGISTEIAMKPRAVVDFILSAAAVFFLSAAPLEAFEIKPDPAFSFNDANPDRGNDSLVGHFKAPVHERITGEALCPGLHYQNPDNYNFPDGISRAAVYWGSDGMTTRRFN
jgi:hypothetical protein